MPKFRNLAGEKFGRLTVVDFARWEQSGRTRIAMWQCSCSCGETIVATRGNLTNKQTTSCGCYHKERASVAKLNNTDVRLDPRESAMNKIYSGHKSCAKMRNLVSMEKDAYFNLAFANCATCGALPSCSVAAKNAYLSDCRKKNIPVNSELAEGKVIYVNGVDRIDSTKGYIEGNVQTMCFQCNAAKSDYTQNEFEEWALRLAANISTRRAKKE